MADDSDLPVDPTDPGSGSYPPQVVTDSLPTGTIGTAYSQALIAAYGTGSYTWAITAGSLPAGLALDAGSGILSGTPTAAGTLYFVVTVTDSSSATGAANLSLGIPAQPAIVNSSLPAATVGIPYTAALAGTGGASPYTFAITAGSLPAGLTLASTGGIRGTATTQGTFHFTVSITDSGAPPGTNTATFSIAVQRASLTSSARTMDDCLLIGSSDGALYVVVPGQRHDEDYDGNPVGIFQGWLGVPTPGGKLALNQLGGATVSAKGNGLLNVYVVDDIGGVTAMSSDKRPMLLSAQELARDFMAKAVPKSVRFAPGLDNGGVIDAWFEAHVFTLWTRAFFSGRKG